MMRNARLPAAMALMLMLSACAIFEDNTDYNRHRLTDITLPRTQSDVFYYDVTVTAEFPPDDAMAEASRMKWLDRWLKGRNMCPAGYDIVKRRPFSFEEDNPAQRNLRYEVRCKPAPAKK